MGRRQAAVDQTRTRILAAAGRLLLARRGEGAGEFSLDAVARRAGVARMTVYYQFGSKRALLEALFDDLARRGGMEQLATAFRQPDPEVALAQYVATFGRFWTTHRAIHRRLQALGVLDGELERALAARQERRRQGLRVIVERLTQRRGRPAGPLDEAIDVLFTLTSFQTYDTLAGAKRSPEDVAPVVLRLARAVLGLKPE